MRGSHALEVLEDPAFQSEWRALHASCPWATVFQSPRFVLPWYRLYFKTQEPVVIRKQSGDALVGLLLLARHRETGVLAHAGTHHAEYQTWLTTPDRQETFPAAAFELLRDAGIADRLSLLFLAPDTPLGWAEQDRTTYRFRTSIRWHKRGLVRLGPDSDVVTSFKKSSNKSRISRLRRIGPVSFEQVTDGATLEHFMPLIANQCDVRQGGRSATLPFGEDPLKAQLYLTYMRDPGLLHFTMLRAGDELLSTHIGVVDTVPSLGLITYAPERGAYSPGKLLMMHLARMLGEQGYSEFDLTPGSPYKDRFATHSTMVAVMDVFLTPGSWATFRAERALASAGHWVGAKLGRDIKADVERAQRIVSRLRRAGPVKVARLATRGLARLVASRREFRIYEYPVDAIPDGVAITMNVNNLQDLLAYRAVSPSDPTIVEFLARAVDRMEDEQVVFTVAEDGLLLHYAWLIPSTRRIGSDFGHVIDLDQEASVLWETYTHPSARGRGLHKASLLSRLAYVRAKALTSTALIGVRADDTSERQDIEDVGFRFTTSAMLTTVLGRKKRTVQRVVGGP